MLILTSRTTTEQERSTNMRMVNPPHPGDFVKTEVILPLGLTVVEVVAVDKTRLGERVSKLSRAKVEVLLSGIDVVLGR